MPTNDERFYHKFEGRSGFVTARRVALLLVLISCCLVIYLYPLLEKHYNHPILEDILRNKTNIAVTPHFVASNVKVTGKCEYLQSDALNLSLKCANIVINSTSSDGIVAFYFSTTDGNVIIFHGEGAHQVELNPNTFVQPVSRIILVYDGEAGDAITAKGICRYTNPYIGKSSIVCRAETASGVYEGHFGTDGKAPTNISE